MSVSKMRIFLAVLPLASSHDRNPSRFTLRSSFRVDAIAPLGRHTLTSSATLRTLRPTAPGRTRPNANSAIALAAFCGWAALPDVPTIVWAEGAPSLPGISCLWRTGLLLQGGEVGRGITA